MIQLIRDTFKYKPVVFDLFLITVAYTIAHGLMFFNHGIFWDDWILYGVDPKFTIDRFRQFGVIWLAYLHLLVSTGGISTYRVVTFGSYLLAAWCLFGIAKEVNIDRHSRFWIVLFFAIFPVNNARMAMINLPYHLCYFLFFLGFWLTALFVRTRSTLCRVAALVLLLISFITNSLLVFYLIILLFLIYQERPKPGGISAWLHLVARYADYLLLPIFFWAIKLTFLKPFGLYAGYNHVSPTGLKSAFFNTLITFDTSFLEVIDRSIGIQICSRIFRKLADESVLIPFGVLILTVTLLFGIKVILNKVDRESWKTLWFFLFGFCAFWLAAFPYVVVGKLPKLNELDTRHQLLLPLGSALLLVYGVKLFTRYKPVILPTYIMFFLLFLNVNLKDYLSLQRDWYKQMSIIENMQQFPVMYNSTSFLFTDQTRSLNINGRSYCFYEYIGLMKMAFGDEKRFADDLYPYFKDGRSMAYFKNRNTINSYYLMGEFIPKEPDTFIQITQGATDVSNTGVLKLIAWEHFNSRKFAPAVFNIVQLAQINGR